MKPVAGILHEYRREVAERLVRLKQRAWRADLGRHPKRNETVFQAARYLAQRDDSLTNREAWSQVSTGTVAHRFKLRLDEDGKLTDGKGRPITFETFRGKNYWRKVRWADSRS